MADITMPQLGETVTEGTITKWMKSVGDQVAEDEVLYEVSTDKVDSEVPSPVAGYLAEIVVAEGDTAEVGARLAVISDSPPGGSGGGASDGAPAPAPAAAPAPAPEAAAAASTPTEAPAPAEVPADPVEEQESSAADEVATSELEQMGEPEPAAAAAPEAPGPATEGSSDSDGQSKGGASLVLSPVVRRLIAEHGLDPTQIQGTGVGGRVTREDVLNAVDDNAQGRAGAGKAAAAEGAPEAAPTAAAPAAAPAESSSSAPAPAPARRPSRAEAVTAGDRDEVIPFSNIRRRTAEHMVRSRATSAHTLVAIEVDYEKVDSVRGPEKERFRELEGVSLTYLPFIARATVDAIRDYPQINASVGDDQLIVHRDVNLGIAVDMDFQGLIVPVIQEADGKRLRALAREIADLGRRAKSKKLSADEIAAGTFTITNAGGYGTLITGAIINQPQVAILSTDGVKPQPVAVPLPGGGYGIAVHPVGNLALTWDHRAVDGAYAAAFLARIKEILETRDWAAELS